MWRRCCWVALAVGLSVGGWLAWTATLHAKFERRVEDLRDAGHPTALEDFLEDPVPEPRNAAALYRRAVEQIGETPLALDGDVEIWGEEDVAAAQEWLAGKGDAVAILHRAAAMPGCDFDVDWTRGPDTVVPFIPFAQTCATTLEAYAQRAARAGDATEALRCVETMMRLGNHVPRPAVICYLVRLTVYRVAIDTLEEIASGEGFDPEAAQARLEPLFARVLDRELVLVALQYERAQAITLARRWMAGEDPTRTIVYDDDDDGVGWMARSWLMRPYACKDGLLLLDNFAAAFDQLERFDIDALVAGVGQETRDPPYFLSSLLASLPSKLGTEIRVLHARVAVARAGLAALVERKRLGSFPAELPVPLDPYTGQPLRYEARPDGTAFVEAARPIPHPELREEDEISWTLGG